MVAQAAPLANDAVIELSLSSSDIGLEARIVLPATQGPSRAPFPKLLGALSTAGFFGKCYDVSQEAELERYEAEVLRRENLRKERHDFYAQVQTRFDEMAETIATMKRDYYKEIDYLREQLSRQKRDANFEPDTSVVFFDPSSYRLPSWESIVEQLDALREKRKLQDDAGGDRLVRMPIRMLCPRCRHRVETAEESTSVDGEFCCDQAVQTDWECLQSADCLHASEGAGSHSALELAAQLPMVSESDFVSKRRNPQAIPGNMNGSSRYHSTSASDHGDDLSHAARSGKHAADSEDADMRGRAKVDTQQDGNVGKTTRRRHRSRTAEAELEGDGELGHATISGGAVEDGTGPTPSAVSTPSSQDSRKRTGKTNVSRNSDVADAALEGFARTTRRDDDSAGSHNRIALTSIGGDAARDDDAAVAISTRANDEAARERAKVLGRCLEKLFSRRRRTLYHIKSSQMTRKERAAQRMARHLEAIQKHLQRAALARLRRNAQAEAGMASTPQALYGQPDQSISRGWGKKPSSGTLDKRDSGRTPLRQAQLAGATDRQDAEQGADSRPQSRRRTAQERPRGRAGTMPQATEGGLSRRSQSAAVLGTSGRLESPSPSSGAALLTTGPPRCSVERPGSSAGGFDVAAARQSSAASPSTTRSAAASVLAVAMDEQPLAHGGASRAAQHRGMQRRTVADFDFGVIGRGAGPGKSTSLPRLVPCQDGLAPSRSPAPQPRRSERERSCTAPALTPTSSLAGAAGLTGSPAAAAEALASPPYFVAAV